MLRPQANTHRDLLSLDGMWSFALEPGDIEEQRAWTKPLPPQLQIPVPSSYNDIFIDSHVHNHVGWVYYQRQVAVPRGWSRDRIYLRVDAATHRGRIYVDEHFVTEHIGGYTPFQADITHLVKAGKEFRLTIAVNNELSNETIPPGRIETLPNGTRKQHYQHDFYNYAGLARSVWLYSVPDTFIQDITVNTDINEDASSGLVKYSVAANRPLPPAAIHISIIDEENNIVVGGQGAQGTLSISSPRLWQPGSAYLYRIRVALVDLDKGQTRDLYMLPVGIRKIEVREAEFLINHKPFYFKGFGKHEDLAIRGKGFDPVSMVHDFQLMHWIGANSFRTAHYPHAEEVLDYADRHGIVVIDETPAVGLNLAMVAGLHGTNVPSTFSPDSINESTREMHAHAIRELVARDKNHPCVVLWAIANEPASSEPGAREYFDPLVTLTRQLDPSRPICYANFMFCTHATDKIADLFDVLCLNRYYGWYKNTGDLQGAEAALEKDLRAWQAAYSDKPIIISEYGADTQAGLHAIQDVPWSEEYQVRFLEMYHGVFDRLDAVVGEHVWSFADFQTSLQVFRVDGNKKGVFTRDRRPKAAAFALRRRWTGMDM
ncbi:glycoside hydrolase family 2 protein [Aspergillus pseudodeflectus]|uniref:Beta-glucuronidase n=1 Tax=Aspergillus pseudodeflectus TaxID=176178 RepID=A0ABR4JA06_9EURO